MLSVNVTEGQRTNGRNYVTVEMLKPEKLFFLIRTRKMDRTPFYTSGADTTNRLQ